MANDLGGALGIMGTSTKQTERKIMKITDFKETYKGHAVNENGIVINSFEDGDLKENLGSLPDSMTLKQFVDAKEVDFYNELRTFQTN